MFITNHLVFSAGSSSVPVVTGLLQFRDGATRSVAAVYRNNFAPRGAGWEPVHVADGFVQSHAFLNQRLAAGDVLYYLDGALGTGKIGHNAYVGQGGKGAPLPGTTTATGAWSPGWWRLQAQFVPSADAAAFAWGTQQLVSATTGAPAPASVTPPPAPAALVPAPVPVVLAPPAWHKWALYGGIALAGVLVLAVASE